MRQSLESYEQECSYLLLSFGMYPEESSNNAYSVYLFLSVLTIQSLVFYCSQ